MTYRDAGEEVFHFSVSACWPLAKIFSDSSGLVGGLLGWCDTERMRRKVAVAQGCPLQTRGTLTLPVGVMRGT